MAALLAALVREALARMRAMIEEGVDRMKTDARDVPLIAVGGGAFLVPDSLRRRLRGRQRAEPGVANAVGAAIAQVSGEVDQIFRTSRGPRPSPPRASAPRTRPCAAGALREQHQLVEVEDLPLAYLPGNSLRVRVRVVGDVRT